MTKITNFSPAGIPVALDSWSTGITSLNSNVGMTDGGLSALNFVQRITADGSNILLNPAVNFASGSNITFTFDGSVPSNTLRIHSPGGGGGGSVSFATPAIVLGTAAVAGGAPTVIASDSTIAAFDTTVPVTQAFSDSAATGSAAFAARRDHKHGMPANPGGGSGPAWKVPVQEAVNTGSSASSQAATFGTAPTSGNLLILCSESEGGTNISGISQTNVTWTKVAESTAGTSPHAEIWKGVVSASAGTLVTVTYSGTTFCGFHASEWNGITGTLDQSASITQQAQTGNKNKIPSITPTNVDALVIFCAAESTFASSFFVVSPHLTTFYLAGNFGSDASTHGGFGMAFGFPGTNPVYGWVQNPRGGNYSAVTISLT